MTILDTISKSTGLSRAYIERVVRNAPYSYKEYKIPKKSGGERIIHHPRKELKVIQRWLVEHVISLLPVHDAVFSYRKGIGIRSHAEVHKKNNFLMRLDLQNFFPSISAKDISLLLKRNKKLINIELDEDIKTICRALCIRTLNPPSELLTIGAPSSPAVSNAILFLFDAEVDSFCKGLGVRYTRYADDMYFSTNQPNVLNEVAIYIREQLNNLKSPKLLINEDKIVFTSRKRKRIVTGITLTCDRELSVGREAKRSIKTEIFLFSKKQLPAEKLPTLKGRISYYQSIEPQFIDSLKVKFGAEIILSLISN